MTSVHDRLTSRAAFTGERFVPGESGAIKLEHLQRYALCRDLVRGKRVLDLASGEGYGSALLAQTATCVLGVDIDQASVVHARRNYASSGRVEFLAGSVDALPLANASIDVVVSFETIEHHDRHDSMLREIARVMRDDGVLVLSSPNRPAYAASRTTPNIYHVKELDVGELHVLTSRYFRHVRLFGQRLGLGSFVYDLDSLADDSDRLVPYTIVGNEVLERVSQLVSPLYVIAVCSNAPVDRSVIPQSIILDPADDLYQRMCDFSSVYDSKYPGDLRRLPIEGLRRQLSEVHRQLTEMQESRSWRLTAPLRTISDAPAWVRQNLRPRLRGLLQHAYHRAPLPHRTKSRIKSIALGAFAWLRRGARRHGRLDEARETTPPSHLLEETASLTPAAVERLIDGLVFPRVDDPDVSVVIPVHGRLAFTLRCLRSLRGYWPAAATEVIVVDDGSPDRSEEWLSRIPGLRVVARSVSEGFIRSSNDGARAARGRMLLFLNNDTQVLPGWCDELWRTFSDVPSAGIVGSKLIYPDGQLQEAGGIVWRDGSAWNVGQLRDPGDPAFNYRREVDYVSGASLAVPRDLFWQVGGFDERYRPAYCEDCDLAIKVRAAGYRVLYQPLSEVIHHEGATAGRDLTRGAKAAQVVNAQRLGERWRDQLATHGDVRDFDRARDRYAKFRVLVLDHCTPTPDQDAGSAGTLTMMQILQRLGGQVTFVPESNYLYLDRYTSNLQRGGIEVLYAPYVVSVKEHLREKGERYDLVVFVRYTTAARHVDAVQQFAPAAKTLLHAADLHHVRQEREARLMQDEALARCAEATKVTELEVIRRVGATLVHSSVERDLLERDLPGATVDVIPWVIDPGETSVNRGLCNRSDIAFVAGYQHPPNVDAALFFALEVFPLVKRAIPDVKFYIVGSNPPEQIRALGRSDVIVTGFVPDLAPILDRIRVGVAPIRYGAGIKAKVLTFMSSGVPCVATHMAIEGLDMSDGQHLLVASDPQGIALEVVRLYRDDRLWARLSQSGSELVKSRYTFDRAAAVVQSVIQNLGVDGTSGLASGHAYRFGHFAGAGHIENGLAQYAPDHGRSLGQ